MVRITPVGVDAVIRNLGYFCISVVLFCTVELFGQTPVQVLRPCDVLSDLRSYHGKSVAIVGRYSFRQNGRFFSEAACEHELKSGDFQWPASLQIVFDDRSAPKPPEHLELDSGSVYGMLGSIQLRTQLAKFRFGTPDYDRWAVAFGRIEITKDFEHPAASGRRNPLEPAPATLICVGDAAVVFLVDREEDPRVFRSRAAAK